MFNRIILLCLIGPTSMLICDAAHAQRTVIYPTTDTYGYLAYDHTSPVCGASFVDISAGGTPLVFTPSGTDPALDEGGAVIPLIEPFEIYGEPTTSLVISSNGYLAAATGLATESGADFSNDCPLPAVAEEGPSSAARIVVLHDDLDGSGVSGPGSDGVAYHEHFASCPRPSLALGSESCTIVQWSDWRVFGSSTTFDLQAVLYHQSSTVVTQYGGGDYTARPLGGDHHGASIGMQNATATTGVTAACDLRSLVMDGSAFCIFDPRNPPPISDLWVEFDEKVEFPAPGGQLEYFLRVVNPGPGVAVGVSVATTLPPEITTCTWTCTATPGSSCAASGSGPPVADTVDLGARAAADFEIVCDLHPSAAGGTVTVDASITAPAGHTDPDLGNNTASAATDIPIPVTLQSLTVD